MTGRELYIGAHLLDRQLLDREGVRCGKVDDIELSVVDGGPPYVSAVVCGPGALLTRTRHRRLGQWMRRLIPLLSAAHDGGRIPVRHVAEIGNHVTISLDADQLASHGTERWVQDHVISHLPGATAVLASELLGTPVHDVDGVELGHVDDLRLVQDGPLIDGFGAALRVSDLVVGPGGIAVRLGYVRHGVEGPALVRWWARRSERRCLLVPWAAVAHHDLDVVRLSVRGDELDDVETALERREQTLDRVQNRD